MSVPAVVSLVTLGVTDLARATEFYQALGWPLSSSSVPGEVSFFRTAGPILSLYPHELLAKDSRQTPVPIGAGYHGSSLAINVGSEAEVDAVLAEAAQAGATILKPAHATDWGGYSGYFADLDGHAFEVAHNPYWPLDARGLPVLAD